MAAANEVEGWGCVTPVYGEAMQAPAPPPTTPVPNTGALAVRIDKATGAVELRGVPSLPVAFDAFKAALLLWRVMLASNDGRAPLLM